MSRVIRVRQAILILLLVVVAPFAIAEEKKAVVEPEHTDPAPPPVEELRSATQELVASPEADGWTDVGATASTEGLRLFSNSSARLWITPEGRVGVGTDSPPYPNWPFQVATTQGTRSGVIALNTTVSENSAQGDLSAYMFSVQNVAAGVVSSGYSMGLQAQGLLSGAGTIQSTFGSNIMAGNSSASTGTVTDSFAGYFRVFNGGAANGSKITSGYGVYIADVEATTGWGLYQFGTDDRNYFAGKVGIGAWPVEQLHVAGNVLATGTITGGNIVAKYQDVAEWVPTKKQLDVGTVVVLDGSAPNHVMASGQAYDTSVAGVISGQPGLVLGEAGDGKTMVATTGRVRVKADATSGPITIGDILVTGEKPGVAMRSEPTILNGRKFHQPGTILGKALEPLSEGEGEILILLSLQ